MRHIIVVAAIILSASVALAQQRSVEQHNPDDLAYIQALQQERDQLARTLIHLQLQNRTLPATPISAKTPNPSKKTK